MRKLKNNVLLISPQFGLCKGGIQTWAYYIDKLFIERKVNISSYGLRECRLKGFFKIFFANFTYNKIILMSWKMAIAIVPAIFMKKSVYIFIHGDEFLKLSNIQRFFLRCITKQKNIKFIANSSVIADLFENNHRRKTDKVIHPFIDTTVIGNDVDKEKSNIVTFFTITRLVKRKNIDSVICALKKLKKTGKKFKYYIAGDGDEKEKLEKLVLELELSEEVKFLGRITEEEKNEYFKKATLFLLPSVLDENEGSIEGFGIVYIEANMYGLPVISGNTGGVVEAVVNKKTGFTTNGSVDDIYRAIENSLSYEWQYSSIKEYACKFDYRQQEELVKFILDE